MKMVAYQKPSFYKEIIICFRFDPKIIRFQNIILKSSFKLKKSLSKL